MILGIEFSYDVNIPLKTVTECEQRYDPARNDSIKGKQKAAFLYNIQYNILTAILQYLKQQNLIAVPVIPEMQRFQNNMDGHLSRNDLGDDEKARQYMQQQNRFLKYNHQLNSMPEAKKLAELKEQKQTSATEKLPTVPTQSQDPAKMPATPAQAPLATMATCSSLIPSDLTPPTSHSGIIIPA